MKDILYKAIITTRNIFEENQFINPNELFEVMTKEMGDSASRLLNFMVENSLVALDQNGNIFPTNLLRENLDFEELENIYEDNFKLKITKKQEEACLKINEIFSKIKNDKEINKTDLIEMTKLDSDSIDFVLELLEINSYIIIKANKILISNIGKLIKSIDSPNEFISNALYLKEIDKNEEEEGENHFNIQLLNPNAIALYIIKTMTSYPVGISKLEIIEKIKKMTGKTEEDFEETLEIFEFVMDSLIKTGIIKKQKSIGFINKETLHLSRLINSFQPTFISNKKCILVPHNAVSVSQGGAGSQIDEEVDEIEEDEDYEEEYEDYYKNKLIRRNNK